MTSPPINGTNTAKIASDSTTKSSSPASSPTTPKAKTAEKTITKTNGLLSGNNGETNGNGVNHHNLSVNISSPPTTCSPSTTAQADNMERMHSIEPQGEQENQEMTNDEEPGSSSKRDLYVGNLYSTFFYVG